MPNTFNVVNSQASDASKWNQVNQNFAKLDAEAVTKKFGGPNSSNSVVIGKTGDDTIGMTVSQSGKSAMIVGKYQSNPDRYGVLIFDDDGNPVDLNGQAPDDGRPGHWVVPAGQNVLELLGGS